jgi:hypothetical protein
MKIDGSKDAAFLRERISHIKEFEAKAEKVWKNPLMQKLLN